MVPPSQRPSLESSYILSEMRSAMISRSNSAIEASKDITIFPVFVLVSTSSVQDTKSIFFCRSCSTRFSRSIVRREIRSNL